MSETHEGFRRDVSQDFTEELSIELFTWGRGRACREEGVYTWTSAYEPIKALIPTDTY